MAREYWQWSRSAVATYNWPQGIHDGRWLMVDITSQFHLIRRGNYIEVDISDGLWKIKNFEINTQIKRLNNPMGNMGMLI